MRFVIVSYFAPPQRVVASHRVLRLTRALLRAGHEVDWVTQDPNRILGRDASLATLVPERVTVHGIGGPTLFERPVARNFVERVLRTLIWHLPRWLPLPDGHVQWAWRLYRHLPGILARRVAGAVLLCCGPHAQIMVVPALRRRFPELPIFVDYRDLLSGNTWNEVARGRSSRRLAANERRMLARASRLFVNSEEARTRFLERVGPIDSVPVVVMRNAADYELADELAATTPEVELGPGLNLGFFGTLFPRRRLLPVLQALARLAPEELARCRLHCFIGQDISQEVLDQDLASVGEPVAGAVVRHELLPFVEALRAMQAMDALLLVNSPHEEDAIFVPGKLYDYLMARRPVLFVGYPGDAERIVAKACGPESCFTYHQSERLAQSLRGMLSARPPAVPPCEEFGADRTFAPLLELLRG